MSDRPVRVGVVGFGYWGPNLVRNLDKLRDAELVAACDLSEDNLAKMSALYPDVKTTTDLDALLADYDLDAVVVATSAPSHYAIASKVIAAGKHCFVEKPLTLKSVESEALVRAADSAGVTLMVGHLMEYHSAINWIKDYIASLAPHDVSIVPYLLGETPEYVSASLPSRCAMN